MARQDNNLDLNKIVTYALLALLGGGQGWVLWQTPEKIKQDAVIHTDKRFEQRFDSLCRVLESKEYAKGMLESGAMDYKQMDNRQAREYLGKVFAIADEAIKNDSTWRYIQRPYVDYLYMNRHKIQEYLDRQYLVPFKSVDDKLYFQWSDGVYPIKERNVNGGVIRFWRDSKDDQHSLQSISSIKDR